MSETPRWYNRFPGSGAADHARTVLGGALADLEAGDVEAARAALGSSGWRRNFDWAGVPPEVMDRLDVLVDVALHGLGDQPHSEGARDALREAFDLFGARGS